MGLLDDNSPSMRDPAFYKKKREAEKKIGRKMTRAEFIAEEYEQSSASGWGSAGLSATGTSIFDPVLCELQYLWYTAEGDLILDPFAGGSVRGIVAHKLSRRYIGIDLREEQIQANRDNAEAMGIDPQPVWMQGDSLYIDSIAAGEYDFIMTCPPYGPLEKYSNDPGDLSNMTDAAFDETYTKILQKTAAMLKDDRFACIVVGNYRDQKGFMRDLCGLTIRAMESAGCRYYNDSVFVTPCGSLPIRIGKQFKSSRKIGKTHQYILIFCKGNPKAAAERLGEVEIPDMSEYEEAEE